jgi:hypothetical protein
MRTKAPRAGLDQIKRRQKKISRYSVKPVKGEPLRTNLDNVAEVIAEVEGDSYK